MSKQYGLIIPGKKQPGTTGSVITRPSIFDEDSDSDSNTPKKPTGISKSLKKQDKITQSKAVEEDPTVYQYDEIYDQMDKKRQESKLSRKDLDKKPKYINRLMAAAERRKQENERRIEREVQKEREAEGEEFKDKESFVTTAYRKKLEERKLLEEQEKREEYLEAIGDVTKQGNLDGFYRHLYDQKINFEETDDATNTNKEDEKKEKASDVPNKQSKKEVTERKYRNRVHESSDSNDEEQEKVEVKKEHLPSNLDADSDFSIDSSDSEDEPDDKKKLQEGDNKDTSNQAGKDVPVLPVPKKELTEALDNNKVGASVPETKSEDTNNVKVKEEVKDDAEPKPKKPKIDIWKKRTVGEVFDAALQRYFERKAARQAQG